MKKQYTKKQITEAIAYWKKMLNESTANNIRYVSQSTKDVALSEIIDIMAEYFRNNSSPDEVITAIARTLEDYELDPSRF